MNRKQQLTTDWVTPQEAADYLGVAKNTVLAWCKAGRLVSSKLGYRTLRISATSIEKMMAATKQ
jgi:excisionase family DNA binding protein